MAEANKERIFDEFVELVSVPCHTLKERQVFELLQQKLKDLGFVTQEDDAGRRRMRKFMGMVAREQSRS